MEDMFATPGRDDEDDDDDMLEYEDQTMCLIGSLGNFGNDPQSEILLNEIGSFVHPGAKAESVLVAIATRGALWLAPTTSL